MFRKLLNIIGGLVLIIFIIGTLAFSSIESRDVMCKAIKINVDSKELIKIEEAELLSLVKEADKELFGKKLGHINADKIEKAIEKHDAILKAEVYKVIAKDTGSFHGVLGVNVKHREPVVRIITNSSGYYLDQYGGKIPVSRSYTANVLVSTGNISRKFAREELLPFVLFIEDDEFWNAQIEQIHVKNNKEIVLTPLVGDHLIELGSLENYPDKLRNMKAFYKQVLVNNNWNKYKSISLKYNNQVIAKRR